MTDQIKWDIEPPSAPIILTRADGVKTDVHGWPLSDEPTAVAEAASAEMEAAMDERETEKASAVRLLTEASAALAEAERQLAQSEETRQRMAVEAMELRRALGAESDRLDYARQELIKFKDAITRRLHDEADERGWCEEFDIAMAEEGLARRTREYDLNVEFTVKVGYRVSVSSDEGQEAVIRGIDKDAVTCWLDDNLGGEENREVVAGSINVTEAD